MIDAIIYYAKDDVDAVVNKNILTSLESIPLSFTVSNSIEECTELVLENKPAIVIAVIKDAIPTALAEKISTFVSSSVIIMTNDINAEEKLKYSGAFILPQNADKIIIAQAIKFCIHAKGELNHLRAKYNEIETKLADAKIISRAKFILIQYLRMNEKDAHKYIQKQAMARRVSQRSVAEDILKTYEF